VNGGGEGRYELEGGVQRVYPWISFCGLHVVFIAYNKCRVHGIADTCCTPLGFTIVLSVTALCYEAHAVSIFRVEMLVSLNQTPLSYNAQDKDLHTESLHTEPMTTPMAPKINTNSKASIKTSKHVLIFRDLRQLVSARDCVCDVSHTDVRI